VIDSTRRGRVALLRMAYGKANALDVELCDALTARPERLRRLGRRGTRRDREGRMFSAGLDLVRILDGGAAYVRELLPSLNRMLAALFSLPKPVVAAVNGHAIAGRLRDRVAADYRLMAREAGRIGIPNCLSASVPRVPLEIMRFAAPQHMQALAYRASR
jgi:enoyl-CoA hydratase